MHYGIVCFMTSELPRNNAYSPDLLRSWATDDAAFQRGLPKFIGHLLSEPPITTANDEAIDAYAQMMRTAVTLHNTGSEKIRMHLYGRFAEQAGYVKSTTLYGQTFKTPRLLGELTESERFEWNAHIYTAHFPRDVAIDAVRMPLGFQAPSVRYVPDPSVHYIHDKLLAIPHYMVHSLLPDITDEEARGIFGQLTTAAIVEAEAQKLR